MNHRKVVVYVDDDPDDLELMTTAFEQEGDLRIRGFLDQDEFVQYLLDEHSQICLALIDINMPLRSGIELAELISHLPQTKHLPIVLFSTSSTLPPKAERQWSHIRKPVSLAELQKTVALIQEACSVTVSNL